MPIWLRNFTFNKIKEFHEEQQAQNTPNPSQDKKSALGPDIQPSYSTKASK